MNASSPPNISVEPRSGGIFYSGFAFLLELFIEVMVRVTGRRMRRSDAPWLHCYLDKPGLIPTPRETVPAWRVSEQGLTCQGNGTVQRILPAAEGLHGLVLDSSWPYDNRHPSRNRGRT